MSTVTVGTYRPYQVVIERGLLRRIGEFLPADITSVLILTDDNLENLVPRLAQALPIPTEKFVIPHGEQSKNYATVLKLCSYLMSKGFDRKSAILNLGGGVVEDIGGFTASIFKRGIRYYNIPTTLLAAIDSSLGGKTGVDFDGVKNVIGSFYQPYGVFTDLDLIPDNGKAFTDGIGEAIKYGVLIGESLLCLLENGTTEKGALITECVRYKAALTAEDEKDEGKRKLLNLGHTIGHAIETLSDFSVSHGEAVVKGIYAMARAEEKASGSNNGLSLRIAKLAQRYDMDVTLGYSVNELLNAIAFDKKVSGECIDLVVPRNVGDCVILRKPLACLEEYFS